jgi:hypothetical protein
MLIIINKYVTYIKKYILTIILSLDFSILQFNLMQNIFSIIFVSRNLLLMFIITYINFCTSITVITCCTIHVQIVKENRSTSIII